MLGSRTWLILFALNMFFAVFNLTLFVGDTGNIPSLIVGLLNAVCSVMSWHYFKLNVRFENQRDRVD